MLGSVAPGVLGAALLTTAAVGVLTMAPAASEVPEPATALAAPVEPAVTLERGPRVSRDSSRQSLGDAAGGSASEPRSGQAREKNAALAKLAASAEQAVQEILENAWQLPLAPGSYRLTARFGECSGLWSHCHTGLDFAAPSGTPIRAVANGVITEAGYAGAYGNRTVMTLEDGTEIWYCHQTGFAAEAGDSVVGGQVIGYVGSTGNSTGPHLHLEVRPGGGDAVDPFEALSARGQTP